MAICSWLLWLAPWRKFHVWHATNSYMSHKDKCVPISNSCISNKLTSFCVPPLEVHKEILLVCIWEVAHLHYWIELVMQRSVNRENLCDCNLWLHEIASKLTCAACVQTLQAASESKDQSHHLSQKTFILFLLPGRPWCIINPFTHLVSFESVSCFFGPAKLET